MHVWLADDPVPARPRHRTVDAAAGAVGEMAAGKPIPNGTQAPPEQRGRGDQQEQPEEYGGPPETGGLPEARRDQTAEPAQFVDVKSLRLSGRDAHGKMWNASLWLPQSQPDGHLEQTGDRLYDLVEGFADNHVSVLARYQAMLDQHYRARR